MPTFQVPMSSPKITTMLGFAAWANACGAQNAPKTSAMTPRSAFMSGSLGLLLECKDFLPVGFHADDNPVLRLGLVERLVELADVRGTVVGEFAFGIVVVDEQHQTLALAGGGDLQHLQVAV